MGANDDFTSDQFRKQLDQLKKMGDNVPAHVPGLPHDDGRDPKETLLRIRRMIDAMTEQERCEPDGIDLGHRQRIAAASDTDPEEVARFLEEFKKVRKLMRKMSEMSVWQRIKMVLGFEKLRWDEKE